MTTVQKQDFADFSPFLTDLVAFALQDAHGVFVAMNTLFADINNATPAQYLGKPVESIKSFLHNDDFYFQIESDIQSGFTWRGTICNKASDGTLYWVDATLSPITRNGQNYILHIYHEISELKQQIFAHQAIYNSATHAIITCNPQGKILHCNPGAERMLGHSLRDISGKFLHEIYFEKYELEQYAEILTMELDHPVAEGFETLIARCLDWATSDTHDWTLNHKNHSKLIVEATISPLFNEIGNLNGYVFIGYDVTSARELEAQQKMKDRQLQKITEQLPGAVFDLQLVKGNLMLSFASAAMYGLFNLPIPTEPQRNVNPKQFFQQINSEDLPKVLQNLELSKQTLCNWQCEFRITMRGHIHRWILCNATPEKQENGDVYWCGYLSDHTDKKINEAELIYANHHDALTELYNRRHADHVIERIQNNNQFPVSIISIDLNDLKKINDQMGHEAGDQYIRRTAAALKKSFRESDMVARMGGDEFLVLLPNANSESLELAHQRLLETLTQMNSNSTEPPLSLAIGMCIAQSRQEFQDKLREADEFMYAQKRQQKGQLKSQ